MMSRVKWNFEKWIITPQGQVHARYVSTTGPLSLESTIVKLLDAADSDPETETDDTQ